MTQMRFLLAFLLITLLFFSESLPSTSAHDNHDHHEIALTTTTTTPARRGLRSHLNLKENMKLRVYMKKKASSGGIANRARGKSSAGLSVQNISSFHHVGSVLACSLLLAGFFKL